MSDKKGIWRLEYFEPLTIEEVDDQNDPGDNVEELT